MQDLLKNLKIQVNDKIYVKDPESSDLGKRIIQNSILLINEIGFDGFTFKKLGIKIQSNESSIYRYFENKHKLLIYLTSWYWAWMEYQIVIQTFSISDSTLKLQRSIEIITKKVETDSNFSHIDETLLNRIVINEYSKSFLTQEVDADNKQGYFAIYKRLVLRISSTIAEVNPSYPFASSLASSIVHGSLHQHFLADHFPSITNFEKSKKGSEFYQQLVFKTLQDEANE